MSGEYVPSKYTTGAKGGKKKSLKDRVVQDLRDIVTSIPKWPAALAEEALAIGQSVAGPGSLALPSKKLHIPHIGTIETNPQAVSRATIAAGFKQGGRQGVGQVLQSPGVRLIPGTYVASNVVAGTPGELSERPLMAALDVLPYVGKATRVATKGGTLATRAAGRAEQLGKLNKAERITQRGLEPRQLLGEVARSAEESLIRAKSSLTPLAPSRLMEVSGLGGPRFRQFMTTMGVADREFATQAKSMIDDTMKLADEFQVSPQRIKQITNLGESGAPNWRQSLQPNEQSWLSALETKANEFTQHQIAKGKLFEFGGEVYPVAGQKRLLVAKNRLDKATRQANKPQGAASQRRALTEQKAALAETERLATAATPARFVPAMGSQVKRAVANLAHGKLDEVSIGEVTRHYLQGDLKTTAASLGEAEVKQLARDIHTTWQDLRSAGHDPLYLHHISPSQAKKELLRPKLSREIRSPSFVKNRSMNMEPSVNDLAVGVSAMGVEHLRPIYAKRLWNELREKRFLFTREEAINDIRPLILSDIAKGIDETVATNKRMAQMYGTFSPDRMFPVGKGGIRSKGGEWYLPKGLHRALTGEKIGILKQADLGPLAKVTSVPMAIFRMSILGLNPAYYVGNLVSGAVMLAAHNPLALKFFPKAIRMIRNGEIPKELSIGWREGSAEQAQALGRFKAAGELGDILTKADQARGLKPVMMQVGKKVVAVPRWLNKMASSIDDMYKVMGYLSEQKKGLRQGLSKQAAHQAGIELAHKVLVDFDRMTPLERTAIRSVMPFASWTSHILRYTLSYPFDHPWRAAIVSSLSRNISNEWPEGLPERFKKDLFFDNNSKRFTLGNYIPMMNVPDIFSVSGLFSRLNPALQTLMEYSGSDPFTYAAPVFGARETEFDPVSGRRVGKRPSLVGKALEISPQVHQVWAVLSKDPEWQKLKEVNPEAARAAAWRAFGIPLPRDLDITKEVAKARKDETAQARADAKKEANSGATSGAEYVPSKYTKAP